MQPQPYPYPAGYTAYPAEYGQPINAIYESQYYQDAYQNQYGDAYYR